MTLDDSIVSRGLSAIMTLNLLILTCWFAINPQDVKEGIGYRYVGLYGSLTKALLRRSLGSKVFWYSNSDQSLRIMSSRECKRFKKSIPRAIINAVSNTLKDRSYLGVVIAFPSGVPRIRMAFEYVFCLLILRIFSIERVRIFIDDFDPVESAYAFSETRPSIMTVAYSRTKEMITLKMSSFIITISEFWRQHIARTYHLSEDKIFVVSNGSLIKQIDHKSRKSKYPFVVLYSGSALKVKDVDKLVSAVANLRHYGLHMELYIAGAKLMDLPPWVHVAYCDWPNFVDGILFRADVCVIPYPPNRFGFFHSVPAKLLDYMAAGKPIISTNLKEVGDIIRSNNCGLIAKDWTEFEAHLRRLYEDRELATKLGNNGRAATEKYFNYEELAEMFLERIIQRFEVKRKKHAS